jgi:RNA polymerase sigma-70 factor (ECF subfamily)
MTTTDTELLNAIERVRNGDRDAFRTVVELLHGQGYSLARRMMATTEDAEDALQEAFVRCYRALPTFRGSSAVATWFYRIVYTTCLNMLDVKRRRPLLDGMDEQFDVGEDVSDDGHGDLIPMVLEALDGLPVHYRTILGMFYIQDCSIDDIHAITHLAHGTIKARLSRGRNLLRAALHERLDVERNEA